MIEVEKKFVLKPGDRERLLETAEFVSKKVHTDVYYDTADFRLGRKDNWLRKRNENFELKMAIVKEGVPFKVATSDYRELETDEEILSELGLSEKTSEGLEVIFQQEGFIPFAEITTTRERFIKEGFTLDFDVADYGFEILEIELLVEKESETSDALERIKEFAEANSLESRRTRGKVLTYFQRFRPELYALLFPDGDDFWN